MVSCSESTLELGPSQLLYSTINYKEVNYYISVYEEQFVDVYIWFIGLYQFYQELFLLHHFFKQDYYLTILV